MNFRTFDNSTFAMLLGAGAAALAVLHLLRVRRHRRSVPSILFWQSVVRTTRARSMAGRFRHPRTYAFLVLLLAVLLGALAEPVSTASTQARALVLDAGKASSQCLDELRARAVEHGALRAETAFIIARGGSMSIFAPGSSVAARRDALDQLQVGEGVDALAPLIERAAALVRARAMAEVLVLSPRSFTTDSVGLRVLHDVPRKLDVAALLPPNEVVAAAAPSNFSLNVDEALPLALRALQELPGVAQVDAVGLPRVSIKVGVPGLTIADRSIVASSVSGVHSALHEAPLPPLSASVQIGVQVMPGERVLLRAGDVPLVVMRRDAAQEATLFLQADLFAQGSHAANDTTLMALLVDWIHAAARHQLPVATITAGQSSALSCVADLSVLHSEKSVAATYTASTGALAMIEPSTAGPSSVQGHASADLLVQWPRMESAPAAITPPQQVSALALWELLALAALTLLVFDAALHARGRIP
ncbi:MAG: hypothetical protein EXS14_08850 [Planctomycetes bacterium]|nr:hypothetical protein [Planctomycetota bacterium]